MLIWLLLRTFDALKCNERRKNHLEMCHLSPKSSMHHTNISYHHDSDSVSIDDLPSDRQYISSSGRPRAIIPSIVVDNLNSDNSLRPITGKKLANDITSEQKVPTILKGHDNSSDDDSYYSLKRLRARRRGERDEDSGLSRRVRRFYKDQDELIDAYERIYNRGEENEEGNNNSAHEKEKYEKTQKLSVLLTKVSLGVNIVRESSFSSYSN